MSITSTYLEVDHIPEALKVTAGNFFLSSAELTVVNKTSKLLEPLGHQQFGLAYRCSYTAANCSHTS